MSGMKTRPHWRSGSRRAVRPAARCSAMRNCTRWARARGPWRPGWQRHGHHGCGEFDLSAPRWREQPGAARQMAARLAGGADPFKRHRQHAAAVAQRWPRWPAPGGRPIGRSLAAGLTCCGGTPSCARMPRTSSCWVTTCCAAQALEAGRRLEVGPDVFFLTQGELLAALWAGFVPYHRLERREPA